MGTSIILSKFLGIILTVIGVSALKNQQRFANTLKNILSSKEHLFLAGLISLILGSVIISIHNNWRESWPIMITLIGWFLLLKGACVQILPKTSGSLIQSFAAKRFSLVLGAVYTIIGLGLLLKGFL